MHADTGLTRRRFLGATATAALTSRLVPARAAAPEHDHSEFRQRLRGPILSVPTVYTKDFQVDSHGIRNMIDRAAKAGVRVFALTAGNSRYDRLTYDEIKMLTRIFVKAVDGRGITITATGAWWTGQAVDYARYTESLGADAVQVLLPRFGDEETLFRHFRQIAESTGLSLVLHGQAPLPLLRRLVETDAVSAYKEEYPQHYSMEVFQLYGKRLNIFAGGQKSRVLSYQPYGMQAYYSTFSSFAPQVAMEFWKAVEAGDLEQARGVMFRYDIPFFEKWSHAFWRATLEHFGVAKRWLRPPERSFSDAQMEEVKSFFQRLGLS